MSAVIPPANTPFPLKPCSGEIFEQRAECGRTNKDPDCFLSQLVEKQKQHNTANAVNGQAGSLINASVHKSMCGNQIKQHFPKPSGKGGGKK